MYNAKARAMMCVTATIICIRLKCLACLHIYVKAQSDWKIKESTWALPIGSTNAKVTKLAGVIRDYMSVESRIGGLQPLGPPHQGQARSKGYQRLCLSVLWKLNKKSTFIDIFSWPLVLLADICKNQPLIIHCEMDPYRKIIIYQ